MADTPVPPMASLTPWSAAYAWQWATSSAQAVSKPLDNGRHVPASAADPASFKNVLRSTDAYPLVIMGLLLACGPWQQ